MKKKNLELAWFTWLIWAVGGFTVIFVVSLFVIALGGLFRKVDGRLSDVIIFVYEFICFSMIIMWTFLDSRYKAITLFIRNILVILILDGAFYIIFNGISTFHSSTNEVLKYTLMAQLIYSGVLWIKKIKNIGNKY